MNSFLNLLWKSYEIKNHLVYIYAKETKRKYKYVISFLYIDVCFSKHYNY